MFSIIPLSELLQFARTELSGKRRASKGTEFAKAAPARDPPPTEPASGSNGADAEQAPTPPPTADVEAGPAEAGPGEGAAVPAAAAAHEK